ncbi:MAG: hypothetical protein ACJ768_09460 [Gaiellaceae bacterium]
MTDDPNLPRAFRSEAKIDRHLLELGPFSPWHATVRVEAVELRRLTTFRVIAEWTGPPADYMPADPRPGLRQDIYDTAGNLELARAIAQHTADQLKRGQVPDMRETAKHLRQRLNAGPYG